MDGPKACSCVLSDVIAYISSMYSKDPHKDIIEHNIKLRPFPILFPTFESLFLLRAIMETIQSVATIKCALDHSLYKDIKHVYRIKINHSVSLGAFGSNSEVKL